MSNRSILFCLCLALFPLESHALWSCFHWLSSPKGMNNETILGTGQSGTSVLYVYPDGRKSKIKIYGHGEGHTRKVDIEGSNYLSRILKNTSGIQVAKYKAIRTLNPLEPIRSEADYIEGISLDKKHPKDRAAKEALMERYTLALEKILFAISDDPKFVSFDVREGSEKMISVRKGEALPPELLQYIRKRNTVSLEVKSRGSAPIELFLKPANFVETPEGDFGIIDPK